MRFSCCEIEESNDPVDDILEQPQKFKKNDIGSFGKIGVVTKKRSKSEDIQPRVETKKLRKSSVGLLPNLGDRKSIN